MSKKTEKLHIWLSEIENQRIKQLAKKLGVNKSAAVRLAVKQAWDRFENES